jgi:hypothetical protein
MTKNRSSTASAEPKQDEIKVSIYFSLKLLWGKAYLLVHLDCRGSHCYSFTQRE